MRSPYKRLKRETRGQAMLETALILPLLLGLVFNTVNLGYMFLMAINLAASPRSGALYAIIGPSTPSASAYAQAGPTTAPLSVSYLALNDLNGGVGNALTAGVQVCSQSVVVSGSGTNGSGAGRKANCAQYNSSPTYPIDADPEALSGFVLHRVDVTYTFTPPLDLRLFNLVLLATPACSGSGGSVTCTFHRQVSMRAM
jgi:Flp pilus assembly protein TadG